MRLRVGGLGPIVWRLEIIGGILLKWTVKSFGSFSTKNLKVSAATSAQSQALEVPCPVKSSWQLLRSSKHHHLLLASCRQCSSVAWKGAEVSECSFEHQPPQAFKPSFADALLSDPFRLHCCLQCRQPQVHPLGARLVLPMDINLHDCKHTKPFESPFLPMLINKSA